MTHHSIHEFFLVMPLKKLKIIIKREEKNHGESRCLLCSMVNEKYFANKKRKEKKRDEKRANVVVLKMTTTMTTTFLYISWCLYSAHRHVHVATKIDKNKSNNNDDDDGDDDDGFSR